jgi:hypothetical protein
MAAPDEDQTKAALERVEKLGHEPDVGEAIWHELDLKDPRTAKASAERFLEREAKLDLLSMEFNTCVLLQLTTSSVNNAALSVNYSSRHTFRPLIMMFHRVSIQDSRPRQSAVKLRRNTT